MEASIEIDGVRYTFRVDSVQGKTIVFSIGEKEHRARVMAVGETCVRLRLDGCTWDVGLVEKGGAGWAATPKDRTYTVKAPFASSVRDWGRDGAKCGNTATKPKAVTTGEGSVTAPMPGKVLRVPATPGATVRRGETLLTLEAMKMENRIQAPFDGVVESVRVEAGAEVDKGEVLAVVKPGEPS